MSRRLTIPTRMFAVLYGDQTIAYGTRKRAQKAVATAVFIGEGGTQAPPIVQVEVRRVRRKK